MFMAVAWPRIIAFSRSVYSIYPFQTILVILHYMVWKIALMYVGMLQVLVSNFINDLIYILETLNDFFMSLKLGFLLLYKIFGSRKIHDMNYHNLLIAVIWFFSDVIHFGVFFRLCNYRKQNTESKNWYLICTIYRMFRCITRTHNLTLLFYI